MLKIIRNLSADDVLILLIVGVGAVLRFYRLDDIPFTHDEFSAILRTQFSSFHELIEKGIKIDGHPAGVQVFLYYLVRAFGVSEALLKFPFILCGVLSIWLVYLVGKDWFSAAAGLVAASFMAFLQYPVMYSQVARPYASGLCFALLMVYFWTKVLFHPQRRYYLNLAGYMVAGALCAYNHHFSMLFAAMVGITGLFFCPRVKLVPYILAGTGVIILYIPHLPVLFYQLQTGGVESWLNKPRYDFLFDYIRYVFQFSVYIYLLIIVIVSLSLYWYKELPAVNKKFILISLVWFLLPFLIGFFYSKFRSSVLQYSVLIFSFPFLLFLITGYLKNPGSWQKIITVALVAMVVIPSLIFERQHFRIFYKGAYREILADSKRVTDSLGSNHCEVILDTKKEINRYYLDKLHCEGFLFRYFDEIQGKQALLSHLDSSRADFLAFGCLSSSNIENYALILEKFPWLVQHRSYAGGDFYLFSKNRPAGVTSEYFYIADNSFEPCLPEWGWVNENQCIDSLAISGNKSFANSMGSEFSPAYSKSLRDLIRSENDVIDVSVDLRTPSVFPGAWLVLSVTSDGKDIKWSSAAVNDYVTPGNTGRVFLSLRISDLEMRHHRLMFNTYIWNPKRSPYIMDNFKIAARTGNPLIYGLYRKIDKH